MSLKPFRFTENRVWRCYLGGKLIDRLRGNPDGVDDLFPEDWIASVVEALNPQHAVPGEGISTAVVARRRVRFDQLVAEHAEALFGAKHVARHGKTPGFLAKLLDSAIRLPLQAHPDRETARRVYQSEYGKTEVWIVVDTRAIAGEEPYLLLGFNESLDREVFVRDCLKGQMQGPLGMVHKHPVKAGDVVLLTGGLIHAIGPGVFLVEIMEPSDLVTQPDPACGKQPLTLADRFGKVAPEQAMEVFHYTPASRQQAWAAATLEPRLAGQQGDSRLWTLVGPEDTPLFGARRLDLRGEWRDHTETSGFFAGAVLEGEMTLASGRSRLRLPAGATFFVPYSTGDFRFVGTGVAILALPPVS